MSIRVSKEGVRGCGYRQTGGLYLVADPGGFACGGLPIALDRCAACGAGVKFSRGWTWLDPAQMLPDAFGSPCGERPKDKVCLHCPIANPPERLGLLWVGKQFYPTPADFLREATAQGISRRIPAMPREFRVGDDWVALTHLEGYPRECPGCGGYGFTTPKGGALSVACPYCTAIEQPSRWGSPGLFTVFKPQRAELIVDAADPPDAAEIDALAERGIEPVIVERLQEQLYTPDLSAGADDVIH